MHIKNHYEVEGLFHMVAIRPDGTQRELAPWQRNMILDHALNYMGGWRDSDNRNQSSMAAKLAVGTGSTPVEATDVALESFLADNDSTITSAISGSTAPPWYVAARQVFVFSAGRAAGNLTELGLCQQPASSSAGYYRWYLTRALIKNEAGDPITVTVLPDEILQVTYELRVYLKDTSDHVFVIKDGTTDINVTVRPYRVGRSGTTNWFNFDNSGTMGIPETYLWGPQWKKGASAIQPPFDSSQNSPGDSVPSASTTADRGWSVQRFYGERRVQLTVDISIARGAHNDIRYLHTMSSPTFNWSFGFSPSINKSIDETLAFTFESSWGRYTP